jgi:uncharacterized protein YjbI with pentapeptide repeats
LKGANLGHKELDGTFLVAARLDGADFYRAQLLSTELTLATFGAASVRSAEFSGSIGLEQVQPVRVFGNAQPVLPLDAGTAEQLYVWSCWSEPPPTFWRLKAIRLLADDLLNDWFRAEWLCAEGEAPRRVGRPAEPVPEPTD